MTTMREKNGARLFPPFCMCIFVCARGAGPDVLARARLHTMVCGEARLPAISFGLVKFLFSARGWRCRARLLCALRHTRPPCRSSLPPRAGLTYHDAVAESGIYEKAIGRLPPAQQVRSLRREAVAALAHVATAKAVSIFARHLSISLPSLPQT